MLLEGLYFCDAVDRYLRIYGFYVFCETDGCGQRLSYYGLLFIPSDGLDWDDGNEPGKQSDGADSGTAGS